MLAIDANKDLIHLLAGLVFLTAGGLHANLLTSRKAGGGAGLGPNHLSMQQVVLGYMSPIADLILTWPKKKPKKKKTNKLGKNGDNKINLCKEVNQNNINNKGSK